MGRQNQQDYSDLGFVSSAPKADNLGFVSDHSDLGFEPSGHSSGEKAQAVMEGSSNFLTGDNMPRIQAYVQSKLPDPNADVNAQLAAKGTKIIEPSFNDYVTARDENAKRNEMQIQEMPGYYRGGQAYGLLTSILAPAALARRLLGGAATAMKYDPFLKKAIEVAPTKLQQALSVGKTGLAGAAMGFAQNPGDTEGQESGLQLGERLQNAKRGLALALAGGGIAQGANAGFRALQKAPDVAPRVAEAIAAHPRIANVLHMARPENIGVLGGLLHGESIEDRIKNATMGYIAGKMIPLGGSAAAYLGKGVGKVGSGLLKPLVRNPTGLGLAIENADQMVNP